MALLNMTMMNIFTTVTRATPYQNQDGDTIILNLPIVPWHTTQLDKDTTNTSSTDSANNTYNDNNFILTHLMNPPTLWESKLWHHISCHSQHDELLLAILSRTPVLACSDAAINTAKFSTFSWIVYSTHPLWQGKGIIPGLVEDVYSRWSKAFGIFTALHFLSNYLSNYPNSYLKLPVIMVYCNNQGVLDRIQKLHQAHTIQSHDATANDYDIYIAIQTALCKLKLITIQFVHVKGHQDNKKLTKTLSIQARLNIECNKHATKYLSIT